VTFTIDNTPFASSIIPSVQGQADVPAIRFFSASLLDLGEFPWESDALLSWYNASEGVKKLVSVFLRPNKGRSLSQVPIDGLTIYIENDIFKFRFRNEDFGFVFAICNLKSSIL